MNYVMQSVAIKLNENSNKLDKNRPNINNSIMNQNKTH